MGEDGRATPIPSPLILIKEISEFCQAKVLSYLSTKRKSTMTSETYKIHVKTFEGVVNFFRLERT